MDIPKASRLDSLIQRFRSSEFAFGTTLGVIVGIVAGLGAVAFRCLIRFFNELFFGGGANALGFLGQYYVILLPILGGLIVGILIHFSGAKEIKGHGQRTSTVYSGLPVGAFKAVSKSSPGIESKIASSCLTIGTVLTKLPFSLRIEVVMGLRRPL